MEETVQEFWDDMEKEVGEQILIRCLGQCISGHPDITKERWGVFFLTGSMIYFKTFKEEPGFLNSLVRRKRKTEDESKELLLGIPLEAVVDADIPKPKKFPQKLFSRPDERASFSYDDGTGQKVQFIYTVATEQEEFYKIFETLLP